MIDERNQNIVSNPNDTLIKMQDYFTSIYKVSSGTIHHIRDEFKNDYHHTKDIYESLTDELYELWRLERRNQGRYEQALSLQNQITELQSEIHTLHGEVGYQKKRPLPTREEWKKRCEQLDELKNDWYAQKEKYSKTQISEENYVDNQKIVFNLRMMVIKSGYIDIDLKDLNRELRNLQKNKLELTLKSRIQSIKTEAVEPERIIKNYTEAKKQNLKRVESFEQKFKSTIETIEQSIKSVKLEIENSETKNLLSLKELKPVEKELRAVEENINQSRHLFSQLIVEERKIVNQQVNQAFSSIEDSTDGTIPERKNETASSEQRRTYTGEREQERKEQLHADNRYLNIHEEVRNEASKSPELNGEEGSYKKSISDPLVTTLTEEQVNSREKSGTRDNISFSENSKNKADNSSRSRVANEQNDKESIVSEPPKETNVSIDREGANKSSIRQKIKNIRKPHNIVGFLRFFIHLWPLATWPLCTLWVAMILPGPYFLLYGMLAAGLIYGAINLSFYIPKLITYLIQRNRNKKLQQEKELQKTSLEHSKEKIKEKNYSLSHEKSVERQHQGEAKDQTQVADILQRSRRQRLVKILKKHGPLLAVMVLGSAVIGGLGVFLMPAILGASLMPLIIGSTFTLGTFALVGTAASIATQVIDKYALEKLQDRFKEKENARELMSDKVHNSDIEQELPKKEIEQTLSKVLDVTKEQLHKKKDSLSERQAGSMANVEIKKEEFENKTESSLNRFKNEAVSNKIITQALVHEPKSSLSEKQKEVFAKQDLTSFGDKKALALKRSGLVQGGRKNEVFELSR